MPKLKTLAPEPSELEAAREDVRPIRSDIVEEAFRGPRLATPGEDQGVSSPALSLQQLLIDGWEEASLDDDGRRWPPGLTILVSGLSAIALWGLIIWAAAALFQTHLI